MITQIGLAAGEILNLFEQRNRPLSMTEIKFYLDVPVDLIYMAVGWLVREGYVRMTVKDDESYLFSVSEEASFSGAVGGVAYALQDQDG